MLKPVVALVGRPNVGKSTLFNRLAGERLAVVDDVPGTTRDRLMAESDWGGYSFFIVDTGGIDPREAYQGDQGEPLSVGSADFIDQIRAQAEMAMRDADVILLLTDVESGVTPADREVAQILRRLQSKKDGELFPPIILVVNKCESEEKRQDAMAFYELGIGDPYAISAQHGLNTGDLLDAVVGAIKLQVEDYEEDDDSVKISIVGKPNAGKSSLLNKLLGEERAIVSPIAGTTRDAVDTFIEYEGLQITLIDTAGIRRRGRIDPGVEKYSVLRSFRAIERSDVALLLIDATTGITAQDKHIAGYVLDAWKSVVVLVNKWDAIEKDTYTMVEFTNKIRAELNFLDYVPVLFISALTGKRVDRVLPLALRVQEDRLVRLPTSQLNKIVRNALMRHPPPSKAGRHFKIYYGTQVRGEPPTFLFHVNDTKLAHFTYLRYLENRIRDEYEFLGTPIRIVLRPRKKE